jgi:class 3 adenylate cyclase
MAKIQAHRRLAAILAADVVGYSRLMEQDETGTLATLKARWREIVRPLIAEHHGRLVKLIGDGVLVEFGSAVDAVQCATELQEQMAAANGDLPEVHRILLRIGINIGDVIVEEGDLYGMASTWLPASRAWPNQEASVCPAVSMNRSSASFRPTLLLLAHKRSRT